MIDRCRASDAATQVKQAGASQKATLRYRSVDRLKNLRGFGMVRAILVEAAVAFREEIGSVLEGKMGEGEERGDDPRGFSRDVPPEIR